MRRLKSEIVAKLDAARMQNLSLRIVEAEKAGDAKIVGSRDADTKKITYAKKWARCLRHQAS